jgi:cupin superfamily acireductone dioxygenase involved in methionine salvage
MPRKKSVRRSADDFKRRADEIATFLKDVELKLTAQRVSWAYEYGILRLYREFEAMMLDALVGAINNDTTTIAKSTGISFPKHLTDEVCKYLIVGDGYFDFKGRDGLLQTLRKYVPDDHYLVTAVKKDKYKEALERLSALRNLAAHNSAVAKARAKKVVGQQRIPDAGSWLKKQSRLMTIVNRLKELADEIRSGAPY